MSTKTSKLAALSMSEAAFYQAEPAETWRAHLRPARNPLPEQTWDREGLEALVSEAVNHFQQATGHALPWNLHKDGSWSAYPYGKIRDRRPGEEARGFYDAPAGTAAALTEEAARLAGWIRAVADGPYPALRGLVCATTDRRGCGSPRSPLQIGIAVKRWPSPGAAEKWLRRVRQAATKVLKGLAPSNTALALGLAHGPRKTGKAALWVAAHTRQPHLACTAPFRQIREALAAMSRGVKRPRTTLKGWLKEPLGTSWDSGAGLPELEGLKTYLGECVRSSHSQGLQLWTGWWVAVRRDGQPSPVRRIRGWVGLAPDGRWFHYASNAYFGEVSEYEAGDAWRETRLAFLKRREASRREAREWAVLQVASVLVTREHSYLAGNCQHGTEAFLRTEGWAGRWYVPAQDLLNKGEARARNAALLAIHDVEVLVKQR